jgi:hypothetical protein
VAGANEAVTVKLVLVHSPLVGASSWDAVAADLAGRGYEVSLPDLTGTLTAGPPYVPRQAEAIARGTRGQPAVLIGRMSHHLAQLTEPGMVAAALCELLGHIGQAGQLR